MDLNGTAKLLMVCGAVLFLLGLALYASARLNLPLFHLPGDIYIKKDNFRFVFPLASCILLSIILSVLMNIFRK